MSKTRVRRTIFAVTALILLTGQVATLLYLAHGNWYERVGIMFQILAFYSIALGFVIGSDLLHDFAGLHEELTSPNLLDFVAGNLKLLGILLIGLSLGSEPGKSQNPSLALRILQSLILPLVGLLTLVYCVFHVFIIMPIAYVGYLLASTVVESIRDSDTDWEMKGTGQDRAQKMRVKGLVAKPAAAKSFLVGIPAAALALLTETTRLFF